MPLASFDGQNSFTINGKTLTNRASSGATPIYDISSSGGSGGSGGILDMETLAISSQSVLEYDASYGRILELQVSTSDSKQGHVYIDLTDFTVLKSFGDSNNLMASSSNPATQIDGTYREVADGITVRTVAEGKLLFVSSYSLPHGPPFAIRHA